MLGITLMKAAEIILRSGTQIDALFEKLDEKIIAMLQNIGLIIDDEEEDKNETGWIKTDFAYIYNLKKKGKGNKNPHAFIAVHVVLFNERLISSVNGWEPTIYVIYVKGIDKFDIDCIDAFYRDDGAINVDQILMCKNYQSDGSFESWMFGIPLVKINNIEDIDRHIIEPIRLLMTGIQDIATVFKSGGPFTKLIGDRGTFSVIKDGQS